ncbi:hypothetical protein TRFO_30025 [Tritrichomonas foetus]|uniref:Man1/Src1 C-terminal domain-containing protein n=1 Tax=Tritrichomonas foetus TaxID=1144522 RepID=A0A1J4JWE7_9EUKA|nr:hypothetical protein TRFO_30025 [Tritrichomonas foetus]|eukprot:OHT02768.1 hypothetical protein TRFO_30025 [Tritrichomonas foetus]
MSQDVESSQQKRISRTPTPNTNPNREKTPSVSPKTPVRKPKPISSFYIVLFSVLSFIALIIAILSVQPENYCIEGEMICKDCPENANCSKNSFECFEGFLKNNEQCLKTNLTEESIQNLHFQIGKLIKEGTKKVDQIAQKINDTQEEGDLIAAILYDDEYLIENNFVIKKPPQLDPKFMWTLFFLFFAFLLASLEQFFYKKYFC